ncbi:phospholipase A [Kaarinaea lacus]
MTLNTSSIIIFTFLFASATTIHAQGVSSCAEIENDTDRLQCYDNAGQQQPETQPTSAIEERLSRELALSYDEFIITPHKPNYFLPVTYNDKLDASNYDIPNQTPGEEIEYQKVEVKFQLSFKVPLAKKFITDSGSLWFAYTQLAFWQLYNTDLSSPFRETNHEPELIWAHNANYEIFGLKTTLITVSLNHQSNGRSEPLSRSWNRIIANFLFEKDHYVFSIKPWYILPETKTDGDNPDINDYMGYGELGALVKYQNHQGTVMLRNIIGIDEGRTTIELNYTFSFSKRIKGIAQYFYGYGESLIDYNVLSNRIGIGILLTDWL